MYPTHPVLWTEGLFLRPQHFQQQDRHHDWQRQQRFTALSPWLWGWRRLSLDPTALQFGRIALSDAQGVMPDGLAFDLQSGDLTPPALALPDHVRDAHVVLAVPLPRPGLPDSDVETATPVLDEARPPPPATLAHRRWQVQERPLDDAHAATPRQALVQLGRPGLRLMLASDAEQGHATLGVCRVLQRRPDLSVELDPAYIPPMLDMSAHPRLANVLRELRGLVHQRAEALAERMADERRAQGDELTELLMLACLNRADPLLQHWCQSTSLHPQPVHTALAMLAGDVGTLTEKRRPAPPPPYRHEDLAGSFLPLVEELRHLLSRVLERHVQAIELTPGRHGVRVARIAEAALLSEAQFVLAASSQLAPDALRSRLPPRVKVASVDRVADLASLQLPGVPLQPLPAAPRHLPARADLVYFGINGHGHPLWQEVVQGGSLALHVAGDLPGLTLTLWALRS